MPNTAALFANNSLLERLPRNVRDRIRPKLLAVSLQQGQIIHKPGDKIVHLHFPTTCMISVAMMMRDGRSVEAGAIGSREVVGINAFMGVGEITQTGYIVQLPGEAMRIRAKPLLEEFDRNTEMREVMLRYTQAFIAQISQNVACSRLHETDQRLARWLLEVTTRVQASEFHLTHEQIAGMLGIRRAGVSIALGRLRKMGIIEHGRGYITIKNLRGLERISCECYSTLKQEYERLLD